MGGIKTFWFLFQDIAGMIILARMVPRSERRSESNARGKTGDSQTSSKRGHYG